MKGKKGSHVGMILSFVVFVGFLIFIYTVLTPALKVQGEKKELMALLKKGILDKVSGDLLEQSLKVDNSYTYTKSCFLIDKPQSIKARVKSETGLNVGGSLGDKLKVTSDNKKFFKIFYLNSLTDVSSGDCETLTSDKYTLGPLKNNSFVVEAKVDELILRYSQDLIALKEELGVRGDNGFGFELIGENLDKKAGFDETSNSVFIEEIPVEYIDFETNIKEGYLKVRIW